MTTGKVDTRQVHEGVIFGHKVCQTQEAKWLRIDDIYQKFYRPSLYDVGGTYDGTQSEYWFNFRTQQIGTNYLLHLFINNPRENSANIALSHNSEINISGNIAFLSAWLKSHELHNVEEGKVTYLTTYNFTEQDVETLVDKKLYIPVKISHGNSDEISFQTNHNFGALLENPIGADFTIESMDGEMFKFHKSVLAVQSEVFNAMLKGDTIENQNNYVLLNDVTNEEIDCLQQYIYTGAVSNQANWANLLVLADRYNLQGLRQLAEHWLVLEMTLDTAVELLVIGDTYNSCFLKQEALKFIKRYPVVLKSSDFTEIQNPELLRELCLCLVGS